jgi:hypothetical protein
MLCERCQEKSIIPNDPRYGTVLIGNQAIPVMYAYIGGDEIRCVREDNSVFYTHYKSLLVD